MGRVNQTHGMAMQSNTNHKFTRAIKVASVADLTGDSVSTVWRRTREDPSFPKPFKLSPQSTVWNEAEILAWIEAKRASSGARP
jgi:prophage regulatory protein